MDPIPNNDEFRKIVDSRSGFILNVRSTGEAMLHLTRCTHLIGFTKIPADFTNSPKFWSESKDELVALGRRKGLEVRFCPDCAP